MCRHASKKGLNEGFRALYRQIDAEIMYDDPEKISEFYHLLILSIGKLKFQKT